MSILLDRPDTLGPATDQVALRELRQSDQDGFIRIHTDPQLTAYLGFDCMDAQQATSAFHKALRQPETNPRRRYTFAITARGQDDLFGIIGLLVEDYGRNAMVTGLAMIPGSPAHGGAVEAGRLVISFAFDQLGMHRVWAGRRHDHTRMHTFMRRCGLQQEAYLRQLFHTGGTWHDVVTYCTLADEWTSRRGGVDDAGAVGRRREGAGEMLLPSPR